MTLTIARRFRGPSDSGNGGYVAGSLAAAAGFRSATVTLRTPPPLDTSLNVAMSDNTARLMHDDTLVAEATDTGDSIADVSPVSADIAREAMTQYAGLTNHPFPECFVCGPQRSADGMRIFPGRLGDGRTACLWTPPEEHAGSPVFVWAALDCPSGWSAPIEGRPMVLGRMSAEITSTPATDEECVVMGQLLGTEGRKTQTRSTVYGRGGRVLGRASATWIALKTDD